MFRLNNFLHKSFKIQCETSGKLSKDNLTGSYKATFILFIYYYIKYNNSCFGFMIYQNH
jgi:hypothetical protein